MHHAFLPEPLFLPVGFCPATGEPFPYTTETIVALDAGKL